MRGRHDVNQSGRAVPARALRHHRARRLRLPPRLVASSKLILAIALPIVLIVVRALVIAPGANNPLGQTTRMVLGSVVLLGTAAALAAAGRRKPATLFAAVIVLNTVLMLVVPE